MCYLLELYLNYKDLGDQSEHIPAGTGIDQLVRHFATSSRSRAQGDREMGPAVQGRERTARVTTRIVSCDLGAGYSIPIAR